MSTSVSRASGIVIDQEHERRRDVRGEVERTGLADLRLAEDLDDADERHEDRVLLEPDEVVEQRRDDPPDGLRQHDVAERLEPAESERPGGGVLARVDGLDAGPIDLGDVRRVDERQRDDGVEERIDRDPGQTEPRDPETEDEDDEDAGQGPEDVDVDRSPGSGAVGIPAPAGCAGPR